MARNLILDSEAISALAHATTSPKAAKRAQAALASALGMNALVRVPAPVLAEVCRGDGRDAAVQRVLRGGVAVVPTTEAVARRAGALLSACELDSRHAVDALVVATAIRMGGGIIATHDPNDIARLAAGFANVKVAEI